MPTPRPRYTTVAIVLHWLIAAAIVFQLVLGWRMEHGATGPTKYAMFQLHKSIGITILLLSLARLGWRLGHRPPVTDQPRWETIASRIVHAAFYAVMIGLPLTGWAIISTSRIEVPTLLWGTVPWPHIPGLTDLAQPAKGGWHEASEIGHKALVYLTFALLFLHLGAVAKHQFVDRDAVFSHMAPGARPGWKEPRLWIVAAMLLAVFAGAVSYRPRTQIAAPTMPQPPAPTAAAPPPAAQPAPPAPVPEPAETIPTPSVWTVQPGGSLAFAASWGAQAIEGRFTRWDADIRFSPDALADSSVRVTVDIASASTGDAQRDSSLPSADWFDAAAHPRATFAATDFRATGKDRYEARGTLTLRGVRKPFTLRFNLKINGDTATANGTTTIDRTRFGVGQGEWAATDQVAAAVRVTFALTAKRR